MDLEDFLTTTALEGSRRTRIFTGLIGAVLGGGIGALWGLIDAGTTLAAFGNGAIGVVLGGLLGALFSGLVLLGIIFAVVLTGFLMWTYLTGGA